MPPLKKKIRSIIFGTETPAGRIFDIVLIIFIILSVVTVLLDSISDIQAKYWIYLNSAEVFFTLIFTIEYALRVYSIKRPLSYIFSFFGIVDFLSIVPTYLSLFLPGTEVFAVIRVLRVLRVFRVLKLVQYVGEADFLVKALVASRRKIFVFLFGVVNVVILLGSLMYLVEGESSGFTSIPRSIYWAIVTLTTVGYGDISPQSSLGQSIAAFIMIIGYCIIAVPTGIVTAEINFAAKQLDKKSCIICEKKGLDKSAKFCSRCGAELN